MSEKLKRKFTEPVKTKTSVPDELVKKLKTSAPDEWPIQENFPLTVQNKVNSIRFLNNNKVPDFWPRILLCGINTRDMIDNPEYVVTVHTDNMRTEIMQKLYTPLVYGIAQLRGANEVYFDGNLRDMRAWEGMLQKNCEIIILDYFWLQKIYFTAGEGYGDKWYSDWIPFSFGLHKKCIPKYTASVFFMPNDRWNCVAQLIYPDQKKYLGKFENNRLEQKKVESWSRSYKDEIGIILLDTEHAQKYCPLWHATSKIDNTTTYIKAPNGGKKTNLSAIDDDIGFVRKDFPIIMFYNKTKRDMGTDIEAKRFILSQRRERPKQK